MYPIFDSHSHYDSERFEDRDVLLPQMYREGVHRIINAASDMPSCDVGIDLAHTYDFVYCSVGVHPHAANEVYGSDFIGKLREMALREEKVVAIGEIGLDYHYDFSPREQQKEVFRQQMALAQELNMPVIIHSREATQDVLDILRDFSCRGVVHAFSGSVETARQCLEMGYHLGFGGVVTFKNAVKPVEVVKMVPADRLLLETDAPYLAPVPHRGKRCDSRMIADTALKIAALRGETLDGVLETGYRNACELFGLNEE